MAEKKISVNVYSQAGEKLSDLVLSSYVFGEEENKQAIHNAIVTYQANMRQDNAKTKKRDEVSGGGKKPWRQKGTGRARAGSSRSPIWVGGGTVFGPTGVQNHQLSQNRKEHNLALRSALSAMVKNIVVVDKFEFTTNKTKEFTKMLSALKIDGKTLLVISKEDNNLIKSAQNLKNVVVTYEDNVSVYDLLYFKYLLTDKETIKALETRLEK